MKDLSNELRVLLDSASRADSMPSALRKRERRRLMQAMAAGSITASAAMAEAALLGASKASLSVSAAASSAGSLTATLVSAVVIGVSSGLVAVSPTSSTANAPELQVQAQTHGQVQVGTPKQRFLPRSTAEPIAPDIERSEAVAPPPTASAIVEARPMSDTTAAFGGTATLPFASVRGVSTTNRSEVEVPAAVEMPTKPVAASIARETELLAQVQRALKSQRALLALATLDRYAEECPEQILAEEATASRVVALCALGRHADGRRGAEQFVRHFPNSPLVSRVVGACPKLSPAVGGNASKP